MKRLISVLFICAVLLASCGNEGAVPPDSVHIESMSFCADGDVVLHYGASPETLTGYVIIKESNDLTVGEADIVFVSENENVAAVRMLSISKTIIRYEITAKSPGETYVFVKDADSGTVSDKIRVVVEGNSPEDGSAAPESDPMESESIPPESESSSAEGKIPSAETESDASPDGEAPPETEETADTEPEPSEGSSGNDDTAGSSLRPPEDGAAYVINKNSKKIHVPSCSSVSQIKPENYGTTDDADSLLSQGYEWCKRCCKDRI